MEDGAFHAMGVASGFIAVVIILVIGVSIGTNAMRQEALRRGFAEYSQQTGEWQWKEAKTAETEKAGE